MSFITDKQTLEDLNLFGRYKGNSVYKLFDRTLTNGGRQLLEQIFREPLTDAIAIRKRANGFRYFSDHPMVLPFTREDFTEMEQYLFAGSGSFLDTAWSIISLKVRSALTGTEEYKTLESGCIKTTRVLRAIRHFISQQVNATDHPYAKQLNAIQQTFTDKRMKWLDLQRAGEKPSLLQLIRFDHCLRSQMKNEMKALLQFIFQLDVDISVGTVAVERGYTYASVLSAEKNVLCIEGLYHPLLEKPVANPALFNGDNNVVFLTGANMAGKSTYMKAMGIAVYLAHAGLPVPAAEMEFSVKDGIFSSINVPDDLEHGYSHFYAEVRRVKKVAETVSIPKNMVVLFDELFKGTNVKDAYEATLSITAAFSAHRNCFFLISTHIIEVGEALKECCGHIRYHYLPTIIRDSRPAYTYQLKDGITADRQGMMIIENEKIVELIRQN
ncbi:DNA mismatch repair protein [Chitinophaga niabensis]|uniref:MutS-related protein n=1 Tax=Chitinophaga niabensis TaxID=536979 RepID=UPI0031BA9B5D